MPRPGHNPAQPARHSPAARPGQPELLSSRDNRWLKRFAAALAGKPGAVEKSVGIEGVRLVDEALRSSIPIEAILVSETGRKHLARLTSALDSATRVLATTDRLFRQVAGTESPQGVAALVLPRRASFDDLVRGHGEPLVIVLAGVQDPGNVGTILRTAEALGASGVATCSAGVLGTAHAFSPKVVRASAGAAFRLPVAEGLSSAILLAQFRVAGIRILAATSTAETRDATPPWQLDLRGPIAFFIGNEGAGLPGEIERAADVCVRIPLAAARGLHAEKVESLNAATASAILLYEAARQRSGAKIEHAELKPRAQTSGANS